MFSMDQSISQQKFTNATVGLQTHEQYKNKAKMYLNHENASNIITKLDHPNPIKTESRIPKKSPTDTNTLSFADEDDEEDEDDIDLTALLAQKQKQKKNIA